jgi:hypothetical protein
MTGTPKRTLRLPLAALLTTMLAVSGLPSLSASGPGNPEILDAVGDVNPAAFLLNDPSNGAAFRNMSAYDLERVYVLIETHSLVLLQFRVANLPDSWAVPPTLPTGQPTPVGANLSQPHVVLAANFTVKGVSYEARANLTQPTGSGVRDTYAVAGPAGMQPVAGTFNVWENTVTISIPKALIGSPRAGEKLTHFRAEGRFGELKLDFAPNAVDYIPNADPNVVGIVLRKLTGTQVVQPQYGQDYTFGNYPGAAGGGIALQAPSLAKSVQAGQSVTYLVYVKNQAAVGDTVYLTLNSPGAGVAQHLSLTEIVLNPAEDQTVVVTVSTGANAPPSVDTVLTAVSRLGDTATLTLHTTVVDAGGGSGGSNGSNGGSGSAGPGSASDGFNPDGRPKKDTPAPALVWVLASLVALIAWHRRR